MINRELCKYLIEHNGKPDDKTWYDVGVAFGVEAPDKERAKVDEQYRIKSIARETQRIWEKIRDGKILNIDNEDSSFTIDIGDYTLERITINPYGGAWLKYRKDVEISSEELENIIRKVLLDVERVDYNVRDTNSRLGLFIYSSDKHIGAYVSDNSIYTNKYNPDDIILDKTLELIEYYINIFDRFDSLFYFDLGDSLDGFNSMTTRGLLGKSSHRLEQNMNTIEQFETHLRIHKKLVDSIVAINKFSKIYFVFSTNSNHGGDFEYISFRALQEYINTKYCGKIKSIITHKYIDHIVYGNHAIIFSHGKDKKYNKQGLPIYLNYKTENYILNYILKNNLQDKFISFVSGDKHVAAEVISNNIRYRKVLSQFGSSEYIHTNFGSGVSGISVDIIDRERNRIIKEDFVFDNIIESNTGIDI